MKLKYLLTLMMWTKTNWPKKLQQLKYFLTLMMWTKTHWSMKLKYLLTLKTLGLRNCNSSSNFYAPKSDHCLALSLTHWVLGPPQNLKLQNLDQT